MAASAGFRDSLGPERMVLRFCCAPFGDHHALNLALPRKFSTLGLVTLLVCLFVGGWDCFGGWI